MAAPAHETAEPAAPATPAEPAMLPHTALTALVGELARRAGEGEPQDSIIEWLGKIAGDLDIRMRCDEYHTVRAPADNAAAAADDNGAAAADDNGAAAGDDNGAAAADDNGAAAADDSGAAAADDNGAAAAAGEYRAGKKPRARGSRIPVTLARGRVVVQFGEPEEPSAAEEGAARRRDHLAETGAFVGRVILSCDRRSSRRAAAESPLRDESNGAVIDARAWSLLVVPPRGFAPQPPAKEVNRGLAAELAPGDPGAARATGIYDVVQVSDGTVVNLYRWSHPEKGGVWCLSTANGYDVSRLKWMGEKAYAELAYELLGACPGFAAATGMALARGLLGDGDVRLAFEALDPGRCYTLGLRHGNFHPMASDPPAAWLIQTAVLATGVPEVGAEGPGLPGVPRQAIFGRGDLARLAEEAGDAELAAALGGERPLALGDLERLCAGALDEAKKAIAEKRAATPLAAPSGVRICPFNYGFILRSRYPPATGPFSDILIESPLLRRVRQLVYQKPPRADREYLDESSRLDYCALRAFLTATDCADFEALFPEFAAPRFRAYREFVDNVTHLVLHYHRLAASTGGREASDDARAGRRVPRFTKSVATDIYKHITQHVGFKAFNENAKSIVHDHVVNPSCAVLYLRALRMQGERP
jgi:hypothetical protein